MNDIQRRMVATGLYGIEKEIEELLDLIHHRDPEASEPWARRLTIERVSKARARATIDGLPAIDLPLSPAALLEALARDLGHDAGDGLVGFKSSAQLSMLLREVTRKSPTKHALANLVSRLRKLLGGVGLSHLVQTSRQGEYRLALKRSSTGAVVEAPDIWGVAPKVVGARDPDSKGGLRDARELRHVVDSRRVAANLVQARESQGGAGKDRALLEKVARRLHIIELRLPDLISSVEYPEESENWPRGAVGSVGKKKSKFEEYVRQSAKLGARRLVIERQPNGWARARVDDFPELRLTPLLADLLSVLAVDRGRDNDDGLIDFKTPLEAAALLSKRTKKPQSVAGIRQSVSQLRKAFGQAGINPYLIETDRRYGYRFAMASGAIAVTQDVIERDRRDERSAQVLVNTANMGNPAA